MLSKIFYKNIYFNVGLAVFLGLAIPFLIIGIFEFKDIEKELVDDARWDIQNSTRLMAYGLSRAVWDYSKDNVEPIVMASLSNENIKMVTIYDVYNDIFYQASSNDLHKNTEGFYAYESIFYNKKLIGKIRVDFTLDTVKKSLDTQVMRFLKIRTAQIFITLIILLLFLHFGFIRRIYILIDNANRLVNRKLDEPFNWKDGDPINQLGQDLDHARISLKSLFAEVSTKNNELSKLNKDLEKLVQEKSIQVVHSARMAALGEMAAGIAHEINNPLSVISGRTTVLEKSLNDGREISREDMANSLYKISKMSTRIAKIVKSLRFFSRNTENDQRIVVSLKQIFEDTLDLCLEKMKNLEIDFKMEEIPEISIECRSVQVSQVILNLINNAIDAVKVLDEKWISVEILIETNLVKIKVKDSGKGIPKDIAEKIMQPFFTTKSVDQGTGLGLSISSGIIEDHGGRLYLDANSPNTCFVVELPKYNQGT